MTTKTERIIRALEARGFVRVELPRSTRLCYTGVNKGGRRAWVWPDKMGGLRGAPQPRYSASLTLPNTAKKLLLGEDTATVPLVPVPEIEVPSAAQSKKPEPTPPETSDDAFTRTWAKMEARGFKYGADALEQVKLGWRLARGEL